MIGASLTKYNFDLNIILKTLFYSGTRERVRFNSP